MGGDCLFDSPTVLYKLRLFGSQPKTFGGYSSVRIVPELTEIRRKLPLPGETGFGVPGA